MEITDNLNQDIINAPQWFKDAIEDRPVEGNIDDPLGNISYAKWNADKETNNLIILIHGTGAVSYTHLTLPTKA